MADPFIPLDWEPPRRKLAAREDTLSGWPLALRGLGTSDNTLPSIIAAGAGLAGFVGTAAAALPSITASGTADSGTPITLPSIIAAGAGYAGVVSLDDVGYPVTLPSIVAAGQGAFNGESGETVRRIVAAGAGLAGVVGTAAVTLYEIEAAGAGYVQVTGQSATVLPAILARAMGGPGFGSTFGTVVLNATLKAPTTYDNYPFNSFAKFNGVYLAAGPSGLFSLTGDDDAGTDIQASVRGGVTDFNTLHLKKVDRVYMGYWADGDMLLRLRTDGDNVRDYAMKATGKTGIHGNYVRMGKGVEAHYFQFEWQNVNGSDFELNMMEVKPTVLKRRISGNHA